MSFYRWAMRNGAPSLFAATLLILMISFANQFFLQGEVYNQAFSASGITQSKFVLFWGSLAHALDYAVWPFFGACLLYRLDRHWKEGQA